MTTGAEYRERLLPTWWVWAVAIGLASMVGVAYGAALGDATGWAVGLAGAALLIALLWVTSPRIVIAEGHLGVGPARLPVTSIDGFDRVGAAEIAALRGPGADARIFTALRPWSCREGVLVRLADDADPHPAWLFSSRHPGRVVEALAATMVD